MNELDRDFSDGGIAIARETKSESLGQPEALGQPKALWNLSFTELWERFSFYGLQGVLTFYLLYSLSDGGLELAPTTAVSIVGAYGGAVYLCQVLGGWIADRLVAPRQMVLYGAVIIAAGHIALAVVDGISGLALGLILIVFGTGALKTNITSIVGMLYADNRTARDAGFSYFYMAINSGAVLGPLLTGFTQNLWGFHAAFSLAAFGMVGAIIQFTRKMRDLPPASALVKNPIARGQLVYILAAVFGLALCATTLWWLDVANGNNVVNYITAIAVIAAIVYFTVILRAPNVTPTEKRRMRGFIPIWLATLLFFGIFLQQFTSMPLFITDRVSLDVGGWQIPAPWMTAIGALCSVAVSPFVAMLWMRLGARQPGTPAKMAIGLMLVGGAYLLLLLSVLFPGKTVPPVLVLVCMAIAGVSDIFVVPPGLAIATRIAPEHFQAQTVALLFLALAAGSSISGLLGTLFAKVSAEEYFLLVGGLALLAGILLALFAKRIGAFTDRQ
ncbi:MFS transporter [Rhodococcus sp. KBS0724]|uniref:peptide MFS transporter n=1 Tax=Rhodococcus sp. KBS0724 TaxID=1179674 RepID=UPI00110F37CF|nr:oligopeptide:H+ symporter [Rhodococcus sp. KBS0724]TSD40396.1 MFS transporter [Rhodococcus sp. KBS0724]